MKNEKIQFLLNKSALKKNYNRDFIEILPVEPGIILAFYEATGIDGSKIDLDAGELKIVLRKSENNVVLDSGKVQGQGGAGNYWFKNIPVGVTIFAELAYYSATQTLVLAKSRSIITLGKAVKSEKTFSENQFQMQNQDSQLLNLDEHIPYNNLYRGKNKE